MFRDGALEAIIEAAESEGSAIMRGTVLKEDGQEVVIVGQGGDSEVGICVRAPIGTDPASIHAGAGTHLIMILDADEKRFTVYRAADLSQSRFLIEERSHPDGMPVAHVLLGDAFLLHYLRYDALEEQERGILEDGPERGVGVRARDVHHQAYIGVLSELRIAVAGDRDDLRTYAARDPRRLADGGRAAGVRDEDR